MEKNLVVVQIVYGLMLGEYIVPKQSLLKTGKRFLNMLVLVSFQEIR